MTKKVTDSQVLAVIDSLPDCDILEACSIDSPVGSNVYYSARTVAQFIYDTFSKSTTKTPE